MIFVACDCEHPKSIKILTNEFRIKHLIMSKKLNDSDVERDQHSSCINLSIVVLETFDLSRERISACIRKIVLRIIVRILSTVTGQLHKWSAFSSARHLVNLKDPSKCCMLEELKQVQS